jgi:hypothetical protein
MELPWQESQQRVKPFISAIEKVAVAALAELIREIELSGVRVVGAGIVGPPDRDLAKIGNFHIRAHAAEGVLFRQVLEAAARRNKLPQRAFVERSIMAEAAAEMRCNATQLTTSLARLGKGIGPPWRAEQRLAALAALLMLAREA